MVIIQTINYALSFPLSVFGSIILAYEKFIVSKIVSIIRVIMIPLITLPILFMGYGSVAMVLISCLVNLSCLLFNIFYARKNLKVGITFGKIDKKFLREISSYSFFIFLNIIVDRIYWQTDQIILGIFTGTISVAVYSIAMHFINMYMQFSNAIAGLLLPRFTIMVANNVNGDRLTQEMIKFGRIQFYIIMLIVCGFFLYGKEFINIWAGANYANAYYIVLIVMLPLAIPLVQNIGISILQAKNMHSFRAILYFCIAILNILVSIPLVKKFGEMGAAFATSISLIIGHVIIMNIYYHKRVGINILLFWKNLFRIFIPVLVSLLCGSVINNVIQQNTIVYLTIKIVLFTIVYSIIIWKFTLNSYEKKTFLSIKKLFKIKYKS